MNYNHYFHLEIMSDDDAFIRLEIKPTQGHRCHHPGKKCSCNGDHGEVFSPESSEISNISEDNTPEHDSYDQEEYAV